jgi:rhodanese-related sulfurtransferase
MNLDQSQSGFVTADGIHNLSPREASDWCAEGAVMLDVREEYISQYKKFGVPITIQIPFGRLNGEFDQLPKNEWIIVADSSGLHSKEVYVLLQQNGFTQVSNLAGGLVEWEKDGMPLVEDNSQKLTGSCACQLRTRSEKGEENTKE